MTELELYHHGVKGQKWGVRRFQNADGSLTDVGKKQYNKELRADKRTRHDLEYNAWESANVANIYRKKQKSIDKKYNKQLSKDPNMTTDKMKRLSETKKILDTMTNDAVTNNKNNMTKLKSHVDNMTKKYADTKIKDVKSKTKTNGTEFVKSYLAKVADANALYSLDKHALRDPNTNKK